MSKESIKVFVRFRPEKENAPCCIDNETNGIVITHPNTLQKQLYSFHHVFTKNDSQEHVFHTVLNHIQDIFNGKNLTVFAYGQTASGKTHTLSGSECNDPGLIHRTCDAILKRIEKKGSLHLSFLEIYNEKCGDLLDPQRCIEIRETNDKKIIIPGLNLVQIHQLCDFEKYQALAMKQRAFGSTLLNQHSSRSHYIVQMHIQIQNQKGTQFLSKLNLVDLAGSEDNKRTGNTGQRLVESGAINKSLFVLGQVVEALNKKLPRIPYRDSKITRLLQDSLGGNAVGILIACCAPEQEHYADTIHTLNFATKASLIKNTTLVTEIQAPVVSSQERLLEYLKWKKQKEGTKKSRLSDKSFKPTTMDPIESKKILETKNIQESIQQQNLEKVQQLILQSDSLSLQENSKKEALLKLTEAVQFLDSDPSHVYSKIQKLVDDIEMNSNQVEQLKEKTNRDLLKILNTGSLKEIKSLKTIGEKRAQLIMEARETPFESLQDLQRAKLTLVQIQGLFKANLII